MPSPSTGLSAFLRRDGQDKIMFGWVQCMKLNMPGVSVEKALAQFAAHYGISDFDALSQETRYHRMVKEYWEDRKTEQPAQS